MSDKQTSGSGQGAGAGGAGGKAATPAAASSASASAASAAAQQRSRHLALSALSSRRKKLARVEIADRKQACKPMVHAPFQSDKDLFERLHVFHVRPTAAAAAALGQPAAASSSRQPLHAAVHM
jgi:hypothetical protein